MIRKRWSADRPVLGYTLAQIFCFFHRFSAADDGKRVFLQKVAKNSKKKLENNTRSGILYKKSIYVDKSVVVLHKK